MRILEAAVFSLIKSLMREADRRNANVNSATSRILVLLGSWLFIMTSATRIGGRPNCASYGLILMDVWKELL